MHEHHLHQYAIRECLFPTVAGSQCPPNCATYTTLKNLLQRAHLLTPQMLVQLIISVGSPEEHVIRKSNKHWQ